MEETSRRTYPHDVTSTPLRRRAVVWFIAWMLTGAGYALGLLGALTIGPYVLLVTVAATIVLATRARTLVGLPGLVSGLSLPLFYVAFLNRSGPGTICTTTATSRSCVDEWSPWPWLVIGVVLLVGGCAWFATANRRRGAADPHSGRDVPRPDATIVEHVEHVEHVEDE